MASIQELIFLTGKTTIITGSASGIGRAIAERFAEAGSNLILIDIDKKNLEKTCVDLEKYDVDVSSHLCDLSKKEEIDAIWRDIAKKQPNILINNAGIYPFKDFLDVEPDYYQRVMDINLNSMVWMCQKFIRTGIDRGGSIVNISSIEAILPFKEHLAHYTISKSGVIALTRALARDYGTKGFRVNSIVPGGIITSGTKNVAKQVLKLDLSLVKTGYDFLSRLPLSRMGQPDEVARMTLVLASELSSYMTGAVIPVDGGFLST